MRRREFLVRSATAAGAAWLSSKSILNVLAEQTLSTKFSASDTVSLGSTGIKTSRLAMGTGTVGSGHHSHQTALGVKGLSDLLLNGYDHGLRFFDSADSYGSHPHVAEALKHVQRDKVTAREFFTQWKKRAVRSRLPVFVNLAKSLEASLPELLNYFTHRISNAMSERFNSVIQQLKAAARGFRNFSGYRRRILFFCGKLDLKPTV